MTEPYQTQRHDVVWFEWLETVAMQDCFILCATNHTSHLDHFSSQGMDFILRRSDNSFVDIIHALDLFLGVDSDRGMERVVTTHQYCLPASCGEGAQRAHYYYQWWTGIQVLLNVIYY